MLCKVDISYGGDHRVKDQTIDAWVHEGQISQGNCDLSLISANVSPSLTRRDCLQHCLNSKQNATDLSLVHHVDQLPSGESSHLSHLLSLHADVSIAMISLCQI